MGFAHVKQWVRHQAELWTLPTGGSLGDRIIIRCLRCRVELPLSVVPGQIVLSKEDRLYLGDDFKATDCEL